MRSTKFSFVLTGLIAAGVLLLSAGVRAQSEEAVVNEIRIRGNRTVNENVILTKIKTRPGDRLNRRVLNEDIKRLYKLGFFSEISVDLDETYDGLVLTLIVTENPVIREIIIEGNRAIKQKKIEKKIESKVGEILSEAQVKKDQEAIVELYVDKGYYRAEVDSEISVDEVSGEAVVVFSIMENQRAKVESITFVGNDSIRNKTLLKVMKTKKGTLFSSGKFRQYEFERDLDRITDFYRSDGYLDAKILDAQTELSEDGRKMYITIEIEEGQRYYVGEVTIEGNETFPTTGIMAELTLLQGSIFTPNGLRKDQQAIKKYYYARGYIDVRVRTETVLDPITEEMDIVYTIEEGHISYVEEIRIEGNTKTRDVVLRRELKVEPGDVCDGVLIKRSQERLLNLGFFRSVYIDIEPAAQPDRKNLVVEVEEAKTGELGFGVGFSSIDKLIGFVEITQKNFDWSNFPTFTGDGQKLRFRTQFGKERQDFVLSWTEPWFLEKPLSFGFDLYRRESRYLSDEYDERRIGGDLRLGKKLGEFLRGDVMYKLEETNIFDVSENASDLIKKEEGKNTVSSMTFALTRDTRNHVFLPTKGMINTFSVEYAGGILGADRDFYKYYTKNSLYVGLPMDLVLRLSAQAGLVDNFGDSDEVPIFERYFLGGANTVRGFKYRDVGPKDNTGEPIGGKLMFACSAEVTFPIIQNIRGAVFYDAGNVWEDTGDFDLGDLDCGAGVGIRLNLPIGPIRLDLGFPIEKDEYVDYDNRLHFNIGYSF